jgi:hypothetical protein
MTIVSHPDAEITDRSCRCHVNLHIDPRTIEYWPVLTLVAHFDFENR